MSVAPLHKSELENVAASLHQHLTTAKYQTWAGYQIEDAYRAMALIGIANNTAFFLTYGSGDGWDDMRDLEETEGTLTPKQTYKRLGNLLYNCTSNDGTDCLPPKYREIIEQMRKAIIEKAAGWQL